MLRDSVETNPQRKRAVSQRQEEIHRATTAEARADGSEGRDGKSRQREESATQRQKEVGRAKIICRANVEALARRKTES